MIKLIITNRYTEIKNGNRKVIRDLQEVTSYLIAGSYFSQAFRDKRWDGREKLLKHSKKRGYHFPTGLLKDVTTKLKELGIKYKVNIKNRRKLNLHKDMILYPWNKKIKLRPYQKAAMTAICKKGLYYGSGILKMPIRSGKTKTVAAIICFLTCRSLIIVPSKSLLYQTQESLKDSLLQEDIGIIGDGKWEEHNITVATAQTLSRARMNGDKRFKAIVGGYDCVVFDEAHHILASTWHDTMMAFDAPHKIGLSATIFPDNDKEWAKGAIWTKACCGNIRIDVSMTELIEQGFLMAPDVHLYKIKKPVGLEEKGWSQKLRSQCIYENKHRNKKIVKITEKYVKKDLLVLIVTNRLNQVDILSEMLDKQKISHYTVTSRDNAQTRINKMNDFTEHSVNVLIGTVLSEGIDIPDVNIVINAEGGTDIKSTIQKMRNLTISPDKKKCHVVDFIDLTNSYFAKHSKSRLGVYRSEEGFNIKVKK